MEKEIVYREEKYVQEPCVSVVGWSEFHPSLPKSTQVYPSLPKFLIPYDRFGRRVNSFREKISENPTIPKASRI